MNWLFRLGRNRLLPLAAILLALAMAAPAACGGDAPTLTVYTSRFDSLVGPLVHTFTVQTGIEVSVHYASNSATAAALLEEGSDTTADVVFLYDPTSLGSLSNAGILSPMSQELLANVDPRFRSANGDWVGISGRARSIAYNTASIDPQRDLPHSIAGFVDPEWNGRVGWAPNDTSFRVFLTAFRSQRGEDEARRWLQGMKANNPRHYANNTAIVAGVARGDVDVGFINHHYLMQSMELEGADFGARNHFIGQGDPGALVLVSGAGIPHGAVNRELAERFVEYLLSESSQRYIANETKEYPLAAGVEPEDDLPPLQSLDPPNVDLGSLTDLQGTLSMLREVGILP